MPRERILVAEDESTVRDMCLRALQLAGYDPVGVADGEEAVQKASEEQFDLLVTDVRLPHMNGLDAYRAIRATTPDLGAVVISGYATMELAIEALKLGVQEFVIKPFQPQELGDAVARALSKQRMELENARLKALIPLYDLSRVFMSSVELDTVLKQAVHIAREAMNADTASLMLLNEQNELVIHAAEGLPAEVVASSRHKIGEGIAGYVAAHREPVVLQGNLQGDPRFAPSGQAEQVGSAISMPLIHNETLIGVVNISKSQGAAPFTEGDVELLSVLASQAAVAIDHATLFQEIQNAYRRLAELDHLKSEFISIAAHELRSPLAVALTYSALLQEEAMGPMREHLAQVVQAAMQLKSIIDEMVSLQRIDTGETPITITDFEMNTTIVGILEELGLLADRKGQRIDVDLPPDLPRVRADQQCTHLILSNLLSNAIKFTPEGGLIRISAEVEDGRVIVAISDTGVGIPPEELEKIFDRFYQVEDSLRRAHAGIGLGLAIAREMAELIDAKIWVESKVDKGSTFYLSLPHV
ncbi:MAG: hypothetical protein A2Y73_01275 [Chloroflexi bacterium RBG_13_56_8]|nr:MAG: hypothetical protein A2Y73_01275 [Chloroflexi bacterium RBG_13_56_8]